MFLNVFAFDYQRTSFQTGETGLWYLRAGGGGGGGRGVGGGGGGTFLLVPGLRGKKWPERSLL